MEQAPREVRLLARRKEMPSINKLMGIGSSASPPAVPQMGAGLALAIMNYSCSTQTPAPRNSTLRVSRHPNAYFHFDCGGRNQ